MPSTMPESELETPSDIELSEDNTSATARTTPNPESVRSAEKAASSKIIISKSDSEISTTYDKDNVVPSYTSDEGDAELKDIDEETLAQELPWHVRRIVSLHDDTALPTITFRYFVLVLLFVSPGAFLNQLNMYRTTSAPYSIFFVQIAANYVGGWLAQILPPLEVKVPFTKFSFNLNPGPFSVKEHVLVVIAAASGATDNLAWTPISLAQLYFGEKIHPAVCIFFMWAIVWTGYSYAAIARQFLIYDTEQPWFHALCQTALFETQTRQREFPSPVSRRQMKVFFAFLFGLTLWQFLPELMFPMLSSLAFLCWVAPKSATANFMGAGLGGMGFLNLSLDWSNVGNLGQMGSLFVTPWYTQVVVFVAFVANCWLLLPLAKWGGLGQWNHQLMSNRPFLQNGTEYPVMDLVTPQGTFNETAYGVFGELYVGTQLLWGMFFDYASYTSVIAWMALFGYPHIKTILLKYRERQRTGRKVNEQYTDQLNVLMRSYDEVPFTWFIALFTASSVIILVILLKGFLYIPIWTYFIALVTGAIVVIPLGWLYAVSNFQLPTGTTNELLYGLMVNSISGHKNPVGGSIYGSIAGNAWYRAQYLLQDQKLGHYMHIPPKAVFFSQLFGSFIGVPINYAVIKWVLEEKGPYLTGVKADPTHQWTGQGLSSSLTMATQYILIGPKRLFASSIYSPLPYGFLVGALAPLFIYILHRLFPRRNFHLWNCTIFFCTMSTFYGNISTGYLSGIIGGFVVMYWAYRHHYELWARYNYILAAAFDSGYNFNMLILFFITSLGGVKMVSWWGNDQRSVERCFALETG